MYLACPAYVVCKMHACLNSAAAEVTVTVTVIITVIVHCSALVQRFCHT